MKKILAMVIGVALIAAIAISGTIAYFTDSDSDTNVFTVGNVVIDLIEQQRGEGGLEPFEQEKKLMPLVGDITRVDDVYGLPTASNFVDKIVTVKNTGKSDAYVRVYVGVPKELDEKDALHFVDGSSFNAKSGTAYTFTKSDSVASDANYNYYCFTLDKALPKDATTGAAIVGFYLDSKVDYSDDDKHYYIGDKSNSDNKLDFDLGKNVNIPVYVQAVQTAGFDDATAAFNEAFKETTPWGTTPSATPSADPSTNPSTNPSQNTSTTPTPGEKVDLNGLPTALPTSATDSNEYTISNAKELFAFAKMVNDGNSFEGKTVKLTADISLSDQQQWTPIGWRINNDGYYFKGTFDGGNHTIYHLTFKDGLLTEDERMTFYHTFGAQGLFGWCEGTIQNLKLEYANIEGRVYSPPNFTFSSYVGGIAGWLDGSGKIDKCTVSNSKIGGFFANNVYNATAGAIVGNAAANAQLTSCTVNKCNVYGNGESAVGRIAGWAYSSKVTGCTVDNDTHAYYMPSGATSEDNKTESSKNIGKELS